MRIFLLLGLLCTVSCSLLSGRKTTKVEDYIQSLKDIRQESKVSSEKWIVIPIPKPRS
jgi:hypothetical protein